MIRWDLIGYFSKEEFKCKHCDVNNPSKELVERINSARVYSGIPYHLNSACRCVAHNAEVGGLPDSAHITSEVKECEAVDVSAKTSEHKYLIVDGLMKAGFKRIFIYDEFVHADVDDSKPSPALRAY